jgi:hypothetical protein
VTRSVWLRQLAGGGSLRLETYYGLWFGMGALGEILARLADAIMAMLAGTVYLVGGIVMCPYPFLPLP